ncbi:hypothetical protein Asp14428_33280 [Actinoplanes sp. NBRC 14428]|nr:hypothetical protein Asp14428_33280 [Actinoplanes sp. NBRC 14428]
MAQLQLASAAGTHITDVSRVEPCERCSLWRLTAAVDAQRLLSRVPGAVEGGWADLKVICHRKLRPSVRAALSPSLVAFALKTVTASGGPDDPALFPCVGLLLVHAAARGLRQPAPCACPRLGAGEEDANGLAAQLPCPPLLIEAAVRTAVREAALDAANPWVPGASEVVASVARTHGAPGWVVLRRLADEALLDDDAFFMQGDQL